MKKLYILFLVMILGSVMIFTYEYQSVNAEVVTINRSFIGNDISNFPLGTDVGVTISTAGVLIAIDPPDLAYDVPAVYNPFYDEYPLTDGHVYYVAVDWGASDGSLSTLRMQCSSSSVTSSESSINGSVIEYIFTSNVTDYCNIMFYTGNSGAMNFDDLIFVDLTEMMDGNPIPTLVDLQAQNFVDDLVYNAYDSISDINQLDVNLNISNLVIDGDVEHITYGDNIKWYAYTGYNDVSYIKNHIYYTSTDFYYDVDDTYLPTVKLSSLLLSRGYTELFYYLLRTEVQSDEVWYQRDGYFTFAYVNDTGQFRIYFDSSISSVDYLDTYIFKTNNVSLYDLTGYYGKLLEPTQEELESFIIQDYYDILPVTTQLNFIIDSDTDFYQYDLNMDLDVANINFTLTETILRNDTTSEIPIYVEKYDLDGNLIGTLVDGTISVTGQDVNGFNYYDYDYNLPSPTSSEDGYYWVAYNGQGGKVLDAGYVYHEPSAGFQTDLTGVRTSYYAVGINNTPNNNISSDYQLDRSDPDEYIFNASSPIVLHYRTSISDLTDAYLEFDFENDTYTVLKSLNTLHNLFHDSETGLRAEGYLMFASDNNSPPLIDYLNTATIFNSRLENILANYESNMNNFLYTDTIPNYKGYYTYSIVYDTGSAFTTMALGESPLFYTDATKLYDFYLSNDSIRVGNRININIYKYDQNIDSIYDEQYIYDTNSLTTKTDGITNFPDVLIYYILMEGYCTDQCTVKYNLANNSSYQNGAVSDAYDFEYTVSYEIRLYQPISDVINDAVDDFGFNSDGSRILLGLLIVGAVTIFLTLMANLPFIIIMIIDFALYSFLAIIGFVPLYTILVILLVVIFMFILNMRRGY